MCVFIWISDRFLNLGGLFIVLKQQCRGRVNGKLCSLASCYFFHIYFFIYFLVALHVLGQWACCSVHADAALCLITLELDQRSQVIVFEYFFVISISYNCKGTSFTTLLGRLEISLGTLLCQWNHWISHC